MGSSDVSSAVFTPPIGSSTSEPEAVSEMNALSVDESLLETVDESLLEQLKDTETKQTQTSESDNLDVFTQDDNVGSPTSEDGSLLEPKEYTDISGPDSSVLYTQDGNDGSLTSDIDTALGIALSAKKQSTPILEEEAQQIEKKNEILMKLSLKLKLNCCLMKN